MTDAKNTPQILNDADLETATGGAAYMKAPSEGFFVEPR